jgi:DNA-binding MarR family transcriptional regulator
MTGITPSERRCLDAILSLTQQGVAPSYAEIGRVMGVAKTAVFRHIHGLLLLGYIERTPGKARSVRVVKTCDIASGVASLIRQYGAEAVAAELQAQL